jgi:polyisoprenoid-binding protein YceI
MISKVTLLLLLLGAPLFSQSMVHQKTEIKFEIDTRFGKAKGEFQKSNLQILDLNARKGKIEIDVASIDTGNSLRDNHLRNDDFFDVPNHPKAYFEVNSIKETNPNSLNLTGKLTIKNIEKSFEIPVQMTETPQSIQYTGFVDINRKDFQINYDSVINPIKDIARVQFTVTFEKKGK